MMGANLQSIRQEVVAVKAIVIFLISTTLLAGFVAVANAKTLFADDFEAGRIGEDWVEVTEGAARWKIANERGDKFLQQAAEPGGGVTILSVDGIASLNDYKEIWVSVRIRVEKGAEDLGPMVGMLIKLDVPKGNWFFTVRALSGEAGFARPGLEAGFKWHSMTRYKDWKVRNWHRVKIALIDEPPAWPILFAKIWPDGTDEPKDWTTQVSVISHLEHDGVGLGTHNTPAFFDDFVVADNEADLDTLAVNPTEKLSITWGRIKSQR